MKNYIAGAAVMTALLTGTVVALDTVLAMPDVHVSYSTDECVKVVNYTDTNYSCENMPKRFNHVWVE